MGRALGYGMTHSAELVPGELIEKRILLIRGKKVILDADLAVLYQVETKALKRAVRRNTERFPEDFMFQLNREEADSLRYQIGTSKTEGRGGARYLPFAFTQEGVAMLSGVLKSDRAIRVNIAIMRTFVKLRHLLQQESMSERLVALEKGTDKTFKTVFRRLDILEMNTLLLPHKRRRIGL